MLPPGLTAKALIVVLPFITIASSNSSVDFDPITGSLPFVV